MVIHSAHMWITPVFTALSTVIHNIHRTYDYYYLTFLIKLVFINIRWWIAHADSLRRERR